MAALPVKDIFLNYIFKGLLFVLNFPPLNQYIIIFKIDDKD